MMLGKVGYFEIAFGILGLHINELHLRDKCLESNLKSSLRSGITSFLFASPWATRPRGAKRRGFGSTYIRGHGDTGL